MPAFTIDMQTITNGTALITVIILNLLCFFRESPKPCLSPPSFFQLPSAGPRWLPISPSIGLEPVHLFQVLKAISPSVPGPQGHVIISHLINRKGIL